ncbi:MAG: dioxygenase [Acidimicrobiales bacterium]
MTERTRRFSVAGRRRVPSALEGAGASQPLRGSGRLAVVNGCRRKDDMTAGGSPGRRPEDIESLCERVLDSFNETEDERLRQLLRSLVVHLHAFIKDVGLTRDEWLHAVNFLTAVGQRCDAERQECVLLSDVLGASMLVELLNDAEASDLDGGVLSPTLPTVLGPFHTTLSPPRGNGSTISEPGSGRPLLLQAEVRADDGSPLAGATVDIWQCNAEGFYDVQHPGIQAPGNGRGIFRTDVDGRVECVTVVPSHYAIPSDGPVGRLLEATGRHPWRPAHIHFTVDADGYVGLTTHLFMPDSPYLDSDAVFAVSPSLICELVEERDAALAGRFGLPVPFTRTEAELVLRPTPVEKRARRTRDK